MRNFESEMSLKATSGKRVTKLSNDNKLKVEMNDFVAFIAEPTVGSICAGAHQQEQILALEMRDNFRLQDCLNKMTRKKDEFVGTKPLLLAETCFLCSVAERIPWNQEILLTLNRGCFGEEMYLGVPLQHIW